MQCQVDLLQLFYLVPILYGVLIYINMETQLFLLFEIIGPIHRF
jgi:hypothetical protein